MATEPKKKERSSFFGCCWRELVLRSSGGVERSTSAQHQEVRVTPHKAAVTRVNTKYEMRGFTITTRLSYLIHM